MSETPSKPRDRFEESLRRHYAQPPRRDPRDYFYTPSAFQTSAFVIFCVAIPYLAIGVELAFRPLADFKVDPLKTWGHLAVLLAMPSGLLAAALLMSRAEQLGWRVGALLLFWNGFAIGVAYFCVQLLWPVLPFMVLAIAAMGMGLLGLSPLFCLFGGLWQAWLLVRARAFWKMGTTVAALWWLGGLATGLTLIFSLDIAQRLTGPG